MHSLIWDTEAEKALGKLDILVARRIVKKVGTLLHGLHSDVIRLKDSPNYRLRVGDYRVIFSIDGNQITVLKVGHRKNVYG